MFDLSYSLGKNLFGDDGFQNLFFLSTNIWFSRVKRSGYIVFGLEIWPRHLVNNPTLKNCFVLCDSLSKSSNKSKYNCSTSKYRKLKHQSDIFHATVIANLIVKHLIQIENGITVNVNVSVKSIILPKKIVVEILSYVFVRH